MVDSRLTVHPGPALRGNFCPPGDKSVTHRALILGALAEGATVIQNPNPGEDCAATLACLRAMGVRVSAGPGSDFTIEGRAGELAEPENVLDCGNSGTTLRLLAGVLASQPFLAVLTGDASLRRRPVDRVIEPLRNMGARLSARAADRLPPLVVQGGLLRPIRYRLPVNSAQVATAILFAGMKAPGTTVVELGAARDHTERMLPAFGVPVTWGEADAQGMVPRSISGPACPKGIRLRVPGDFSAAAFFLAAAAARPGARVTAEGVSLNPTRTGLLDILERMGARVERLPRGEAAGEPFGDVIVSGPDSLTACDLPPEIVPAMVDEIPAWTIAAAVASGTSRVRGAGELRVKESDRLASLRENLSCLGVRAEETSDGLAVTGGAVGAGDVDAAGDHRIAMTFAVLATLAAGPVRIRGAGTIATSFPDFAGTLAGLGGRLAAGTGNGAD